MRRTRVVEPRFAPWVYDPQGNTTSIIVEEGRAILDGSDLSLIQAEDLDDAARKAVAAAASEVPA